MAFLIATVLLTQVGGGTAQASWTAPERSVTASVASGTLAVTQSGFSALSHSYSSGSLAATASITVKNTGSVPAPYTLSFGVQSATALSNATNVRVWGVATASQCTAAAVPAGPTGRTWATSDAIAGTLAPAASAVLCVRSSVTQAQRFNLVGASATVTAMVTATQGTWTSSATASATQTVANTLTPGQTTKTAETDSSISLAWTTPADTAAITGYQIYRDSVLVGTVPASQHTFTDTGLNTWKYYAYTVRAAHSANPVDLSPPSPSIAHATGWLTTTSWYAVRNIGTQLCVDGEGARTASGTAMISYPCNLHANQAWKFVVDGAYLKVTPMNAPSLFWDSASDHHSVLRSLSSISAQKWEVVPVAPGSGTFHMRDRNNMCLDVAGNTLATHTQLRVATCNNSANQTFSLQRVA